MSKFFDHILGVMDRAVESGARNSARRFGRRSALARSGSGGGVCARSACNACNCSRCSCQSRAVASSSVPRGSVPAPAGMARPSARACSLVSSEGELACFMA